jgi:hypothetical protein
MVTGPLQRRRLSAVVSHCIRHFEEPIAGQCRTCNQVFCSRCLVFAFGPKQSPYCIGCALTASGVRVGRGAGTVPIDPEDAVVPQDKRVDRAQKRAEKAALRAAAKAQRKGGNDPVPTGEPRPAYVPSPSTMRTQTAQQAVMAEIAAEAALLHEQPQ